MLSTETNSSQHAGDSSQATDANSNISSLSSAISSNKNDSVFDASVSTVVKEHIFPKKQFIILERELDEHSKLASRCIKALKIKRSEWYTVRNKIRRGLNRRRNNVQQSVRRSLSSKSMLSAVARYHLVLTVLPSL
jgi:hypothetical protein